MRRIDPSNCRHRQSDEFEVSFRRSNMHTVWIRIFFHSDAHAYNVDSLQINLYDHDYMGEAKANLYEWVHPQRLRSSQLNIDRELGLNGCCYFGTFVAYQYLIPPMGDTRRRFYLCTSSRLVESFVYENASF